MTVVGDEVIAVGATDSTDYPTSGGVVMPDSQGQQDGVVTSVSVADGQLIISTYLGASFGDNIQAVGRTEDGRIVVAGRTTSPDLPATGGVLFEDPIDTPDAYVAVLGPALESIEACTYLGGTGGSVVESGRALGVLPSGDIVVAGPTPSTDFPVTGRAAQPVFGGGGSDGFVALLSPQLDALRWSTFLGGPGADVIEAMVVDPSRERILVCGRAGDGFPTTPGSFQHEGLATNAFVAALGFDGALEFSAVFGGAQGDYPNGIAVAANGDVVVVGRTLSIDFPVTPGAYDPTFNGVPPLINPDVFVSRLDVSGAQLVSSTFLGGFGMESFSVNVAIDSAGAVTVMGGTSSADFPTTSGAWSEEPLGEEDTFVARFHPSGASLTYSTYFGGSENESHTGARAALALLDDGGVILGGVTRSTDFPVTPGAFQTELKGPNDAFLARLDLLPTGVARHGTGTPGSAGVLAIAGHPMPVVGDDGFALTCTNAPVLTTGYLALSRQAAPPGRSAGGAALAVDPSTLLALVQPTTDEQGYAEVRVPIPAWPDLVGMTFHAQYLWPDPGLDHFVSTPGLAITVQP